MALAGRTERIVRREGLSARSIVGALRGCAFGLPVMGREAVCVGRGRDVNMVAGRARSTFLVVATVALARAGLSGFQRRCGRYVATGVGSRSWF